MAEEKITETKDAAPAEKKPEEHKSIADLEAEIERLKAENEKQRGSISKASSDAADWKRKYKDTLDAQKQKELEDAEQRQKELEELEALRKDKRISTYAAKLMDSGFDAATASTMANALPDGVGDEYFTATKTYFENQRQAMEAAALKNQSGLSAGLPLTAAQAKKDELNKLRGYAGLPPLP